MGYAERSGDGRGDAAVDPGHHGRGIGTFLAGWLQDTARKAGDATIGIPVPEGSPGDRLLTALGFRVRWTAWVLELPPGAEVPARPLPDGYAVREAAPSSTRRWTVIEDAFLSGPTAAAADRSRTSPPGVMDRPGLAPWNLRVVTDPAGAVVGAAVRGAGLGLRLRRPARRPRGPSATGGSPPRSLVDAFAAARANGAERSELSTDSRTGALGLYENVGMRVTSTWVNRAADL